MASTEREPIGDTLEQQTTAYFDQLEDGLGLLPRLLRQYADDETYRDTADRIRELESDCDRTNRDISSLISNSTGEQIGLRNVRIHLNPGHIIVLYQTLDEIVNKAEQFAEELVAISPPRADEPLGLLTEMAEKTVATISTLRNAITEYVTVLLHPEQSTSIADDVARIRAVESECDKLRNEIIATVFDSENVANPLVYRELALLMDEIVDTMEDVTDQLIFITGNRQWLDIEP